MNTIDIMEFEGLSIVDYWYNPKLDIFLWDIKDVVNGGGMLVMSQTIPQTVRLHVRDLDGSIWRCCQVLEYKFKKGKGGTNDNT